jgi:uncharacterized protein (TIGR00251 family)
VSRGVRALFTPDATGGVLAVKAAPKASRNAIVGPMPTADGHALKVAVTAPADKGKANDAITALVADAFRVPKGAVSVIAGTTDRSKLLRIAGDPRALSDIAKRWTHP